MNTRQAGGWSRALVAVAAVAAVVTNQARAGERMPLDDATMDGLKAGAAYGAADLTALALGIAGRTRMRARTEVLARGVVRRSFTGGGAVASDSGHISSRGSGLSQLDQITVGVEGGAQASGAGAFTDTQLDTRVIDTPAYSLAVGRLRTTACCGPDSATYASGATSLGGLNGYDHFAQQDSQGPVLTRSEIYVVSARYRLPISSLR